MQSEIDRWYTRTTEYSSQHPAQSVKIENERVTGSELAEQTDTGTKSSKILGQHQKSSLTKN